MTILAPRIALIHALEASMAPINAAFAREWPEARRMNLLDDSLSADLARNGRLDAAMTARFVTLADYAVAQGAEAILFTCSAFGPCIDAVKAHLASPARTARTARTARSARTAPITVLAPNEAMIDEAAALARAQGGAPIGLVASFAPTLESMPAEFPPGTALRTALAAGALEALQAGDAATHDTLVAEAATRLAAEGCALIALAQFSLARAAPLVAARSRRPVLTTPDSARRRLRAALQGSA